MLNKVDDPYTSYYNEKETTTFYKELKGTFYGIGCAILKSNDLIYVVDVLENSPAKKSGVLVNDIIKEVNNKSTEKLSAMEVVNIIEDAKKEITLKIIRDNKEIIINMDKDNVVIKSVIPYIHEKNNKKIGYIKINLFAANTYEQFKEELLKLEKNNIDSLIIDVRDNEGGYLTSVSNIVSLFFDKDTVIYQLKTKTAIIKKYSLTNEKRNYNVVILQNNGSASGSEILAGVFKEMYKSEIIGTNSYGKSSVQQTVDLGDGTMFKYTTRQWLTSLGNNIGGFGIEPTIIIEQSEEYYKNKIEENDTQLQKALSILSE
jgi:carboxyl-terminal processing protease